MHVLSNPVYSFFGKIFLQYRCKSSPGQNKEEQRYGHKGVDLLCYIARRLLWEEKVQLLVLGTGEPHFESFFRELEKEFPDRVAAKITFDLGLAARIYAGGDIYLMPSRSEACGLSQLNAMRYGTVPVVHATGGLRDTIPPCD